MSPSNTYRYKDDLPLSRYTSIPPRPSRKRTSMKKKNFMRTAIRFLNSGVLYLSIPRPFLQRQHAKAPFFLCLLLHITESRRFLLEQVEKKLNHSVFFHNTLWQNTFYFEAGLENIIRNCFSDNQAGHRLPTDIEQVSRLYKAHCIKIFHFLFQTEILS